VSAHYRSHVEFSFDALEEAAAGFRRIESFLERADERVDAAEVDEARQRRMLAAEFIEAMNDDLGTPAAIAVIYDLVREGNKLLAEDGEPRELFDTVVQVRMMLDVLGLDPADPAWGGASSAETDKLTSAVDVLVAGLLEQRAEARAAKDFATADAIRDRIKAAGIEIEDTPTGPKWSL
jgi:cysteinyl-tRNA synthetase